jgi:hypothetical protein
MRSGDGRGPVRDVELDVDVLQVRLDGGDADEEAFGDLRCGESVGREGENLRLAWGEHRFGGLLAAPDLRCQRGLHRGRDHGVPARHGADRLAEVGGRRDLGNRLSTELDFIESWSLGAHAGAPNDNGDPWDGALLSDFRSWEDLERYSTAPVHMEVVDKLLPMVSGRAVVDFEVDA